MAPPGGENDALEDVHVEVVDAGYPQDVASKVAGAHCVGACIGGDADVPGGGGVISAPVSGLV
jgi:hypothetical protein